jgi:serine/threonine-protein kinase
MDEGVVGTLRASQPIEFGSIIANKYTVLRPELGGSAGMFVCREAAGDPLRSVWLNHPRHALDPNGEQFLAELTKVARLDHPLLRKLLDFGRDPSGILYAVYEPLELRNLADVLDQDWPLPDERIVWLTCQLLAALEVAHAAGVTHGDLRPENVLVRAAGTVSQNEEILLCGLGLAGSAPFTFTNRESRPYLQLAEWMVGTPPFAAPEQFRGQPRDARSDVYGAGLLLFQLLTRTAPFLATNDLDTAWMQCFTPPPPPSGYGHVSPALEAVCLKALTKTPDVRYQSANEMRAALLQARARSSQVGRARLSRTSQLPSTAAVAGSSRKSSPSIVPAIVVANRRSEPSTALARPSVATATIEMPAVREPARRWKPSASLLLACSALAIAAAVVLPDLKLREAADVDTIVRAEPGEATRELDEPAELPPIELPVRKPALAKVADVAAVAEATPVAVPPTAPIANAKPLARPIAAKPALAPVAAPAPTVVAARAEPARVRVRNIEKSVVAADSSEGATAHAPFAMAIVTGTDVAANAVANPHATLPVIEVEPVPAEPDAVPAPEPQPLAAAPVAAPAAPTEPASAPADSLPRPIVLANTAPKAPAPSSVPHDVTVTVGDVMSSHGAVSKAALRSAFNQAALSRCYRDAVQNGEQPARSVNVEIEFSTNMAGRITAARLSGGSLPPNLARCVEEAARLGRVREADTGELRATVDLTFIVR